MIFPSSHVSPGSITPLPHVCITDHGHPVSHVPSGSASTAQPNQLCKPQVFVHPSPQVVLPSSQASDQFTIPSPHTGSF